MKILTTILSPFHSIQKPAKQELKCIKLSSGEWLVGEVHKELEHTLHLKNVFGIQMHYNEETERDQIGFYNLSTMHKSNSVFTIYSGNITMIVELDPDVEDMYFKSKEFFNKTQQATPLDYFKIDETTTMN